MADAVPEQEAVAVRRAIRGCLGEAPHDIRKATRHSDRRVYFARLPERNVVLKVLHTRKPRTVGCGFATSAMRRAGVPTPRLLAASHRDDTEFFDRPFLIMERAPGIPLDRWVLAAKPPRAALSRILRQLGGYLQRMHRIPIAGGFGVVNDSGVGRFESWSEYLAGHKVRQRSGGLVRVLDLGRAREALGLSHRETERIEALFDLEASHYELSVGRLLHNDLTLKNVLVDPAQLRVTAVIDLHNALGGHPALDLARFHYFYRDKGYLPDLLAGYGTTPRAVGPDIARYLILILLEKLAWLEGREDQFPGRREEDLDLLRRTLGDLLSRPGHG